MDPEKNSLSWEERLARLEALRKAEENVSSSSQMEQQLPQGEMILEERSVKTIPQVHPLPKTYAPSRAYHMQAKKVSHPPPVFRKESPVILPVTKRETVPTPTVPTPTVPTPTVPTPTVPTPTVPTPTVPSSLRAIPQEVQKLSLNTHDYDGKLRDAIEGSRQLLPINDKDFASDLAKMRKLMELYQSLEGGSPVWTTYFDAIVGDQQRSPQNNFDPSNSVDAAQVLYNINLKIKTLLSLTQMQLEDMASGPCPQGRATRLLSVFLST